MLLPIPPWCQTYSCAWPSGPWPPWDPASRVLPASWRHTYKKRGVLPTSGRWRWLVRVAETLNALESPIAQRTCTQTDRTGKTLRTQWRTLYRPGPRMKAWRESGAIGRRAGSKASGSNSDGGDGEPPRVRQPLPGCRKDGDWLPRNWSEYSPGPDARNGTEILANRYVPCLQRGEKGFPEGLWPPGLRG